MRAFLLFTVLYALLCGAKRFTEHSGTYTSEQNAALRNLGLCIDPEQSEDHLLQGEQFKGLMDSVDMKNVTSDKGLVDGWSNWAFAESPATIAMPKHLIIGLYHDNKKHIQGNPRLDSACFEFDYDIPEAADPAGCKPFKQSFQQLARIRTDLVAAIGQDDIWTTRNNAKFSIKEEHVTAATSDQKENGFAYDDWCNAAVHSIIRTSLKNIPVLLCETNFDDIRRAEEMMKQILFQPAWWKISGGGRSDPTADQVYDHIRRKATSSVAWPASKDWNTAPENHGEFERGLRDTTIAAIAGVFGVRQDGYNKGAYEALIKIGPCQALMYDKTEISGLGFSDALVKFTTDKYYTKAHLVQETVYPVPSFCGRMAFSFLIPQQFQRYNLLPRGVLQRNRRAVWEEDCATSKADVNCRSAYTCFEMALNRACGLTERCCPRQSKEVQMVCQENPDGTLLDTKVGTYIPKQLAGVAQKRNCPNYMGTGYTMWWKGNETAFEEWTQKDETKPAAAKAKEAQHKPQAKK